MAGLDANVKLLLHMDGVAGSTNFIDSSDSNHPITAVTAAQISTDQSMFGGASGFFDGSLDRLIIPDHADWDFVAGAAAEYTIDMWVRFNTLTSNMGFISQRETSNTVWLFSWTTTNQLVWRTHKSFANTQISCPFTPVVDTWYHIAITRDTAGDWYMFVDGDSKTVSILQEATYPSGISGDVTIGYDQKNGYYMSGWIDEVRVSNVARWTESFTPPTSEYSDTAPEINVTPAGLTFGNVEVTTTSDLSTTIENTGTADLTVSGITVDNNVYTIIEPISVPFTISASGSTIATIRYSPITVGGNTGSFGITSDDADEAITSITLDGSGVELPDINSSTMSFNFGSLNIGNTSDLSTTLSNTGTGTLIVSGMTVDNDVYTIIEPISVPFNIESAGSTVATVRFSPTVATIESGTFTVTSNDAINSVLGMTLYGVGITPEIDIDPISLNFGNIDVGNTSDLTTTIDNLGSADLTVSGLTVDNDVYTIITPSFVPFVLSVAGSTEATIRFTPVAAGTETGSFTITSDDLDESESVVSLSGNGIIFPEIDISPTSLDYGNVLVPTTSGLTTLISNFGNGTLTVSGITVDNNVYTIIEPISVPFTISASGSTIATINFSPVIGGTQTGTFTVTSDDLDEPTDTVTLSGFGLLIPEINVSPTGLTFGTIAIGSTSNLTTTISNLGTGTLTISDLSVDNNKYTIISPTAPFGISASGSTVATIRFAPIASGLQSGTFTITSDDADEGTVAVTLTGTGADSISESTFNFNLSIDQARDFTSYLDQSINFDLEM